VPECETLDLPILYYTGYLAAYVNSKGTETPLSIHPVMPDYTVRVACPTTMDDGGAIHVAYSGTLVQKASLAANLVFAGAIAIIYRYKHEWLL